SAPLSVAIGDFNGDGKQDIATANNAVNNFGLSSVSIRLGDGLGGFSGNTEVAVGLYSNSVAIGDFNGDGKQDIASANGNDVSIRLGDGLGGFSGFSGSTDIAFAGFNYSLGIGDFNGDGRQDFVTANYNFGTVSIRFGGIAAINLKGNSVDIVSGDITPSTADNTDFGTVLLNTPKSKTYTIQNTGTSLLTINTIEISGADSALFTKSSFLYLPIPIPAGASATFTLTFKSTTVGTKTAIVTINNDDCDERAYTFAVQATVPFLIIFDANGGTGTMAAQTIAYNASVNLTSNAFTRTGYTFAGWATTSTGAVAYTDGASYTMSIAANDTLYAQWTLGTVPVNFISITASRKTTAALVNWKVGNELNIHHYEVERSTDGRNFVKAGSVVATGITDYSFLDINAPAITLFYRVKSVENTGESKYSAVAKLYAEKTTPGYLVAPNPIVGREINVQFKNQPAGKYQLKLFNNAGQQIQSNNLNHAGGNGTQTIQIPAGLARGAYQLEIISADKTSSTVSIFINNK
ncbi:MAG: choice-of-anchor D domain-containing protein, partial [Paludibacter sp.]